MSNFVQSFSYTEPEYKLDNKLNKLVVVGTRDLASELNSSLDCALDKIIAKYGFIPSPSPSQVIEGIGNVEVFDDNLEELQNIVDTAEEYRDKYGFSDDVSIEGIYRLISDNAAKLKSKLGAYVDKSKNEKVENEKEVNDNDA